MHGSDGATCMVCVKSILGVHFAFSHMLNRHNLIGL